MNIFILEVIIGIIFQNKASDFYICFHWFFYQLNMKVLNHKYCAIKTTPHKFAESIFSVQFENNLMNRI